MTGAGQNIWETEEDTITKKQLIDNYLTPNGIFGEIVLKGSVWIVKVSDKTNISEFFIWLGDKEPGVEDDWGWDEECSLTRLGKFGSVLDLWKILPIEK